MSRPFGRELLKGTIPVMVLRLIAVEELYGYEILKRLDESSGGAFSFSEGTLYPILHGLERDGHVQAIWREASGRRRKYYTVTEAGRRHLEAQEDEWRRFSASVDAILGHRPGGALHLGPTAQGA